MKRTLITLLALAGVAFAATPEAGTKVTFSSNLLDSATDNTSTVAGITFNFNNSDQSNRLNCSLDATYELPEILEITSISIASITTKSFTTADFYLAVVDENYEILGISTNSNNFTYDKNTMTVADAPRTFTFDGLQLTTTTGTDQTTAPCNYTMFFISTSKYANLAVGDTLQASQVTRVGIGAYGPNYDTNYSELAFVGGSNNNHFGVIQNAYVPLVSINTRIVPEPTTATLSLLALAGLAARRRRK